MFVTTSSNCTHAAGPASVLAYDHPRQDHVSCPRAAMRRGGRDGHGSGRKLARPVCAGPDAAGRARAGLEGGLGGGADRPEVEDQFHEAGLDAIGGAAANNREFMANAVGQMGRMVRIRLASNHSDG